MAILKFVLLCYLLQTSSVAKDFVADAKRFWKHKMMHTDIFIKTLLMQRVLQES